MGPVSSDGTPEPMAGARSIMMAKRTPPPGSEPQPSLPHENDREDRQPYAREVEDYKHSVAKPPKEEGGREANRRTTKAPIKK
jgi:hypothetical protein